MNCLIRKMVEFWFFSLSGARVYYDRYPTYTSTYDPDNCMIGFVLRLLVYIALGVFFGIILGRLVNAVLGRIEGKKVVYREKPREKDYRYEPVNSELPDEYLQRRKKFRDDEYHNP